MRGRSGGSATGSSSERVGPRPPRPARHDVWVVGHVTRDRISSSSGVLERPGGTATYFPLAFARIGGDVGVLTRLAVEDAPELLAEHRSLGLDLACAPSAKTTEFENRYGKGDPDDREQRVGAVALPFVPEDLEGLAASIFHLGPLTDGDMSLDFLRAAAARGRVSLDVQGLVRRIVRSRVELADWAEKREGLPYVDVLKANEHEATVLTGERDPARAAACLHGWGPGEVLVTLASNGSVVCADGRIHEIAAIPTARPVDPTGCGDTYMAGYLAERLAGAAVDEAARFASASAALKLRRAGPFAATRRDVDALLRAA